MVQTREGKMAEISRNAARFGELLPSLIRQRPGEYALMRNLDIVGFYPSAMDAQTAGHDKFPDGLFSIQKVTEAVEHLGRYSYALGSR
jgi:hypothetical protein